MKHVGRRSAGECTVVMQSAIMAVEH